MSASSNEWYARLGVGIELGPMPYPDLVGLAETGQLLAQDEVRGSVDSEWCPASSVFALFGGTESSGAAENEPADPDRIESPDADPIQMIDPATSDAEHAPDGHVADDTGPELHGPLSDRQSVGIPLAHSLDELEFDTSPQTVSPSLDALDGAGAETTEDVDFELNLPEPVPTDDSNAKPPLDQSDELDFELNLPQAPPAVSAPATPIASPPEPREERAPVLRDVSIDQAVTPRIPPDVEPVPVPESEPEPNSADTPVAVPPPLPVAVPPPLPAAGPPPLPVSADLAPALTDVVSDATPSQAGDSDDVDTKKPRGGSRRRVIRAAFLLVAAGLVMALVWWMRPGPEPTIYADYVAIYKELRERQSSPDAQSGWNEFVDRSKAQIDEANPWLEKTAEPGDRERNLLLYIGRDLRGMLDEAPDAESPHHQRVDGFFAQLEEINAPSP